METRYFQLYDPQGVPDGGHQIVAPDMDSLLESIQEYEAKRLPNGWTWVQVDDPSSIIFKEISE